MRQPCSQHSFHPQDSRFLLPSDPAAIRAILFPRSNALCFLGLQPSALKSYSYKELSVRGSGFSLCVISCVSPRLISEHSSRSLKVGVSIVEIYNSNVFDLLAKHNCTVISGVKGQLVTIQEGHSVVPKLICRLCAPGAQCLEGPLWMCQGWGQCYQPMKQILGCGVCLVYAPQAVYEKANLQKQQRS